MKAWFLSLPVIALVILTGVATGQSPTVNNGGKPSPDLSSHVSVPTGPRHAEIEIKQIIPGVGAVARGGFHDFAPGVQIPPGNVTRQGITMPTVQERWQSFPGVIFIRGLGNGLADNSDWEGMLEPDGTYSYTTVLGAVKTIHAFKLSNAADPVAAYWNAEKAASAAAKR